MVRAGGIRLYHTGRRRTPVDRPRRRRTSIDSDRVQHNAGRVLAPTVLIALDLPRSGHDEV